MLARALLVPSLSEFGFETKGRTFPDLDFQFKEEVKSAETRSCDAPEASKILKK